MIDGIIVFNQAQDIYCSQTDDDMKYNQRSAAREYPSNTLKR